MSTDYEKFQQHLEKHPKALESMARKEQLNEFRELHQVGKRAKLNCPVCSRYMNTGKLYESINTPNRYVCRDCEAVLEIKLVSIPAEEEEQELGGSPSE